MTALEQSWQKVLAKNSGNKLVSYWQDYNVVYQDKHEPLFVIVGKYNHENSQPACKKGVGIVWENFPKTRHHNLAPLVLPQETSIALLVGLLSKAHHDNDVEAIKSLNSALEYLRNN